MSDRYEAFQVRITGRVQGVSFRVWARDEALTLGLTGWVRNEADGSVAALVAGPPFAVSTMIERLRRGPPGASVSGIETQAVSLDTMPAGFRITG